MTATTNHRRFSRPFRRWRRIGLRVLKVALVIVATLLLVGAAVLGTAAGRRVLLRKAIEIADRHLPGQLTVTDPRWPHLTRIELGGALWSDAGDTLATVERFVLDIDARALRGHDLVFEAIHLEGAYFDPKAMAEQLSATPALPETTVAAAVEPAESRVPWLRAGALPQLPSIAVESLRLADVIGRLPDGTRAELVELDGELDLRAERDAAAALTLRARPLPLLGVAWALRGEWRDGLHLVLAPLVLRQIAPGTPVPPPLAVDFGGGLHIPARSLDALVSGDLTELTARLDSLSIRGAAGSYQVSVDLTPPRGYLEFGADLAQPPRGVFAALLPLLVAEEHRQPWRALADSVALAWPDDPAPHATATVAVRDLPAAIGALRDQRPDSLLAALDSFVVRGAAGSFLASVDLTPPHGYLEISAALAQPPRGVFGALLPLFVAEGDRKPWRALADSVALAWPDDPAPHATATVAVRDLPAAIGALRDQRPGSLLAVLDSFVVRGAAGEQRIRGRIDPSHARLTARGVWPRPPRLLFMTVLPLLAPPEDFARWRAAADTVARVWPTAATPQLDLSLSVDDLPAILASRNGGELDLDARFVLPGPEVFAAHLPPEIDAAGWNLVTGTLAGRLTVAPDDTSWNLRADLGQTAWLDRAVVAARGGLRQATLDSFALALNGLEFAASGTLARDGGDIIAVLDVPDASLLRRWRDPRLAGIEGQLHVEMQSRGPWLQPTGKATLRAAADAPGFTLPRLDLEATIDGRNAFVAVQIPAGATYGQRRLARADVQVRGTIPDSAAAGEFAFGIDLDADRLALRTGGQWVYGAAHTLRVDSLALVADDRRLQTRHAFTVDADPARRSLRVADLDLAGSLGVLSIEGMVTPDTLAFDALLDWQLPASLVKSLVPAAQAELIPDGTLTGSLRAAAQGTPGDPRGEFALETGITDNPDLANIRLNGSGKLQSSLITGRLEVAVADTQVVDLNIRYPARVALDPPGFRPLPADTIVVGLKTKRVALAALKPLVPGVNRLTGWLELDVRLCGPGESPVLTGSLDLADFEARLNEGSWVAAGGRVTFGGSVAAPTAEGQIDVKGGLIRLPEVPPNLLPVSARARLWEIPVGGSAVDSAAVGGDPAPAAPEAATAPPVAPDTTAAVSGAPPETIRGPTWLPRIAVEVVIPGGFWLRGYGLDVELEGDVTAELRGGRFTLGGDLQTRRGTLRFLGRVFEVDRGVVVFDADDPTLNPELDIVLTIQLGGVLYRVEVHGRAQQPRMELFSEPPMPEGDIVSSLIFGRPVDDLDSGQEQYLRDRTREVLAAYGATLVSDRLSRRLGVDMLTIKPAPGSSKDTSLLVGKYLSPDVMVQYEQVLRENSAFYVRIEYIINRFFALETTASQGDESGLSLKWSKNY